MEDYIPILFFYVIILLKRYTRMAPTYFPMARFRDENENFCLIDGGIAANNPAMIALTESYTLFSPRQVNFISLGTGKASSPFDDPSQWVYKQGSLVLEALFDSQTNSVETTIDQFSRYSLAKINYARIQPTLDAELMKMDKPENMARLKRAAKSWYEKDDPSSFEDAVKYIRQRIIPSSLYPSLS